MKFFQPEITDLKEVINFNERIFYYGKYSEAYIKYRFIDNPFCEFPLDTIYSVRDESTNKYVGQMMTMPGKLIYLNKIISVYWGMDYIIDEKYRGAGIGKKLTNYFFSKDYYITVGVSLAAAAIHKKMGCQTIGFLNYYYNPISYFNYIKFAFHRLFKLKNKDLSTYSFPKQETFNNIKFKRITSEDEFTILTPQWNPDMVEGIRNKEFIKWRFLYKPDKYFIYQAEKTLSESNPPYIVLRPTFWKGVNCLSIVDMRYNANSETELLSLLGLAKKLAKQHKLFAIIVASSIKKSNEILTKKGFKLLQEKIVLTKFPFDFDEAESHSNNNLMLSLADSDSEFFSGTAKFVYGEDY